MKIFYKKMLIKLFAFLFINFVNSYIQIDVHNELLKHANKHILKAVLYKFLIGKQ